MLRKIAEYVKKIFRMEPIPTTVNTLREALQALEVARNHFEHCDPEFVDAAIFELNAAECRVDAVRRCVGVTTFYFPAYKCSLCEQKFNDGLCYVGLADALNHVPELKKYEPVHHCEHGNIGFGKFAGFERVDKND